METGRRIFLLLLATGASAAGVFRGGANLHAAAEDARRSSGSGISGNPFVRGRKSLVAAVGGKDVAEMVRRADGESEIPSVTCSRRMERQSSGASDERGYRFCKENPGISEERRSTWGYPASMRAASLSAFDPYHMHWEVGGMTTVMERTAKGSGEQKLFDLPVDCNTLFSDQNGKFKKGLEKRQTKLVEKLAFLKPFMKDDEKIVLVTTGCSPMSVLEQLVTGWIVYYLKRSLIVFTSRRIFHIPTRSDFSYRNSIAQINYSDCKGISMKRSYIEVRYKNGTQEKFIYIDRRERRKIRTLLAATSFDGAHATEEGRSHLCPRCTAKLVRDQYTCPCCRLVFKNISEGKKISIMYPGGGYFYTRHPVMGIGDALTELLLMVMVVASLIDVLRGNGNGFVPLAIWGTALIIEKSISVYHATHFIKEFIPIDKVVQGHGNAK